MSLYVLDTDIRKLLGGKHKKERTRKLLRRPGRSSYTSLKRKRRILRLRFRLVSFFRADAINRANEISRKKARRAHQGTD